MNSKSAVLLWHWFTRGAVYGHVIWLRACAFSKGRASVFTLYCFVAFFMVQSAALAQDEEQSLPPVYNPETKSYFAMRGGIKTLNWQQANQRVKRLTYKGARGRLAVIKSPETHAFLFRNLKVKWEVWIGLRYWCTFRKLTWITGEVHPRTEFTPWHPIWERPDPILPCESVVTIQLGYMPIYYTPQRNLFRWQATGAAKKLNGYLVEYVTGAE